MYARACVRVCDDDEAIGCGWVDSEEKAIPEDLCALLAHPPAARQCVLQKRRPQSVRMRVERQEPTGQCRNGRAGITEGNVRGGIAKDDAGVGITDDGSFGRF